MSISVEEISSTSKDLCESLLNTDVTVPEGSVFQDRCFARLNNRINARNEARIVQDIARLIVPSAETLCMLGAEDLSNLIEGVSDGWNTAIPLVGTRPQPDYSVGFARTAFSTHQLKLLEPYLGPLKKYWLSYFMGPWYMHFPFLTSEVKCGSAALEVADRQNAHSMTLAVRAVVNLYREVGRIAELNREILAFSISHDNRSVRIYGHFPVIDGEEVKYFRHPIDSYDLTARMGEKRWTAYKFATNVYRHWAPKHLERLCSAIDQLPYKNDCRSARAAVEPTGDISSNAEAGTTTPATSVSERSQSKKLRA